MIKIRSAKTGDEKQILMVIDEVLSRYGLNLEPNDADLDVTDLNKYYFGNNGWFEVVLDNDKIVGSVGIYKINSNECELRKMYLLEEYQGRGIGKNLLENALIEAKKLGYKSISLQTNSLLFKAIPLYENYGFEYCSGEDVCARCDIAMIKNL